MLECDNIVEEIRLKCDIDVINDDVQVKGNVSFKHKKKF